MKLNPKEIGYSIYPEGIWPWYQDGYKHLTISLGTSTTLCGIPLTAILHIISTDEYLTLIVCVKCVVLAGGIPRGKQYKGSTVGRRGLRRGS